MYINRANVENMEVPRKQQQKNSPTIPLPGVHSSIYEINMPKDICTYMLTGCEVEKVT
jgi:hypothetical protein